MSILRITVLGNLSMLASEMFTEFCSGPRHHSASAQCLFFVLHGHHGWVPWIRTSIVLNVGAAAIFLVRGIRERRGLLLASKPVAEHDASPATSQD